MNIPFNLHSACWFLENASTDDFTSSARYKSSQVYIYTLLQLE